MTSFVVGASGATGKLLVNQLLRIGHRVKVVVRESSSIPSSWTDNEMLTIIKGNISDMTVDVLADHVRDCDSVACCLGHNLSLKGIYGKPRRLVTDSVGLLCEAISRNTPITPVKFVLMNTTGNSNRDLNESVSFGEKIIIQLLRLILPPHPDNEQAADYLRVNIGQADSYIEWVVVRPDTLHNQESVSQYTMHPSPTRSALFNPGKTSRINVANVMARLIEEDALWQSWKGQMPVIYDR